MKRILSLCILLFIGTNIILNSFPVSKLDVIIGIYDGLTEDMEFQFTTENNKVYLFDEVQNDLEVDLYDEKNFGQKFKVTWQKRTIEIMDEDSEPTGEMKEIKVIINLVRL